MSLPLAQTNVYDTPLGLGAKPVVPSPPDPCVAVYQVVPPSGLYCAWMLHVSDSWSNKV